MVLLALGIGGIFPALAEENTPVQPGQSLTVLDAIRLALKQNTNIRLARQDVNISQGQLDLERGRFDLVLSSSFSYQHIFNPLTQIERVAYLRDFETTNLTSYALGASKLLRNGVTLQPNVSVTRTGNTLTYPELPASQAKVAFEVIVPLLRGLGEEATGASERAAELTMEGVRQDYYHTAAQYIYATLTDYWQLREYQMVVEVYADSESRAAKLLAQSTELVKGDQLPRSALTNLRANLDLKSAQKMSAVTQLNSAGENLANTLGIAAKGSRGMPLASQDFPRQASLPSISSLSMEKLKQMALAKRADLKSAKLKAQSAQETLVASLDGLKPKLNMTLSAGYNGLSEDERYISYYSSLSDGVYGPNVVASLAFEFPPQLTGAKGQVMASKASLQKAKLVVDDTLRRIELGVAAAYQTLRSSAQQAKRAKEAVRNYQQAVRDERMKLKLATSTILSVIQVEDQLTSARLNDVYAQQNFATALARLRYETGTLINGDPAQARFSMATISTFPPANERP